MCFFDFVFPIKRLLLVLIYTPRIDFKFGRIFVKIFLFRNYSLVNSLLGSHTFLIHSSFDGQVVPVTNTPASRPKMVNQDFLICTGELFRTSGFIECIFESILEPKIIHKMNYELFTITEDLCDSCPNLRNFISLLGKEYIVESITNTNNSMNIGKF